MIFSSPCPSGERGTAVSGSATNSAYGMCLHVSRSMGSSLRPRHGESRLTPAVPRGLLVGRAVMGACLTVVGARVPG